MSKIPARLSRLEACASSTDLPPLPELATLGALMDAADTTEAERRTLMNARLELLLARVWPRAMAGDTASAGIAVRLLDRQADLLGLTSSAKDTGHGEVTAEDLMRMIARTPDGPR
ncbi:hypothetical protein OG982_06090 [Streptomyces sp. NBC_01551]|uniref:hypothetical protein n=1 Tax=Streptomyces sp. NBC_01551 TaxID=2975876 RepID=UPI00225C2AE0|nr:hypothetical protein [Streptomyces sp. NBC_01551]MCX4525263.1 hypothetical protein [Streptomyces sp. NBC_01551]